jgi:hypothetical protein
VPQEIARTFVIQLPFLEKKERSSLFLLVALRSGMPVAWPIAKFLFKLVAPSIPDIISTISNLKQQQGDVQSREETLEERFTEFDRKLAQQLELIDNLTKQVVTLHLILRRTLIISILALCFALTGLALIFYS